jgi:hypothetical protein
VLALHRLIFYFAPAGLVFESSARRLRAHLGAGSSQNGAGPFQVEAELWYQPIGFRWANNLKRYDAEEPQRFNSYYDSMGEATATLLARSCAPASCQAAAR